MTINIPIEREIKGPNAGRSKPVAFPPVDGVDAKPVATGGYEVTLVTKVEGERIPVTTRGELTSPGALQEGVYS